VIVKHDVREVWDRILPGIESIHSSLPWTEWRIEDVYAECLSGESAIFTKEGEEDAGRSFFVAKVKINPSTGQRVLFLWIAWSPEETGAEAIRDDLEQLALGEGCTAIEFITYSPKIVKHAKQFLGFDRLMYQVQRGLT
jgi:hypothetical protein